MYIDVVIFDSYICSNSLPVFLPNCWVVFLCIPVPERMWVCKIGSQFNLVVCLVEITILFPIAILLKWGFPSMGVPNSWLVFVRENPTKMDDDWGYPYFTKPPNVHAKKLWTNPWMLKLLAPVFWWTAKSRTASRKIWPLGHTSAGVSWRATWPVKCLEKCWAIWCQTDQECSGILHVIIMIIPATLPESSNPAWNAPVRKCLAHCHEFHEWLLWIIKTFGNQSLHVLKIGPGPQIPSVSCSASLSFGTSNLDLTKPWKHITYNVGKTTIENHPIVWWFIEPIYFVIWGMVYCCFNMF